MIQKYTLELFCVWCPQNFLFFFLTSLFVMYGRAVCFSGGASGSPVCRWWRCSCPWIRHFHDDTGRSVYEDWSAFLVSLRMNIDFKTQPLYLTAVFQLNLTDSWFAYLIFLHILLHVFGTCAFFRISVNLFMRSRQWGYDVAHWFTQHPAAETLCYMYMCPTYETLWWTEWSLPDLV